MSVMSNDKEQVEKIVNELRNELNELSQGIYNNPELGNEEFNACKLQIEILQKYGFEVTENFCDKPTAYKAVYKGKGNDEGKQGPKIAMLAEYDALPELGHGCGHNLIATVAVGSGLAIREFADKYGAEIHVIGTPAEETEGAKVEMSRRGAFKEYDAVMMAHPAGFDAESLKTQALKAFRVEFFGRPSHAAGAPEKGLNALDAMLNFFNMVNALRQQTTPDARIHGVIRNGGVAPNIIPEYTEAIFYVRGNKMTYVEELTEKVWNCARGAALGTGTRVEISKTEEDFKDTDSNMYLCDLMCENMEELGHKMKHFPSDFVMGGSSDLGDVSYECPSIQMVMSIAPHNHGERLMPHTWEFKEAAGTEFALNASLDFIKGFTYTAIELMTEPEHLEKIKAEFAK